MRVLILMCAAAVVSACGGTMGASDAPSSCADCPSPKTCVAGSCLPPALWSEAWQLEITPSTDALSGGTASALTELTITNPARLGDVPTFTVDRPATVDVAFTYAPNAPAPPAAAVLLSIPSLIPGRPDLMFAGTASTGATSAELTSVPSQTSGRTGTLAVVPLAGDGTMKVPPRTFPLVVVLGASVSIDVKADLSLSGNLLDPFEQPLVNPFVARAFQRGSLVSNSAPVDRTDGSFVLSVPAGSATDLMIDLVPQNISGPDPWFSSLPVTFSDNLEYGTVKLPPYLAPNWFEMQVKGDSEMGPPVPRALLRAMVTLPQTDPGQAALGTTRFFRTLVTDADGMVIVSLLPGTGNANLAYEIAVAPPTGSFYATTCSALPLGAGGSMPTPAALQSVVLARRSNVSGTVLDAGGRPVPNVAVTATPDATPLASCPMTRTRAAPGNDVTNAQGQFSLPLDPGTYQLDFDPPPGSASPRLTEDVVVIDGADMNVKVSLDPPAVLEGILHGPDDAPLAGATVRIFEPRCPPGGACPPPWLRAEAQSDRDGHFRAVVPDSSN